MKQAIVKRGKVFAEEVPSPSVEPGNILIRVINSCISVGTELSGVISSGRPLVKKALENPEKIKLVLDMLRKQGLSRTYSRIKGRIEVGSPIGYSVSGVVLEVGKGVEGFNPGDRVAAAGAGFANHAEFALVPKNLVVKIPENVSFAEASTVALGAIAMQGVRRLDLKLGEFGVVIGTGILGLLAVQMLRISGVRVIAIDLDNKRLKLAKEYGAELILNPSRDKDIVEKVIEYTDGYGADGVLFAASTSSSEPLADAFRMARKKGVVVLLGVAGNPMQINRQDLYKKELDFKISTSYGPGRYDEKYEVLGCDYPYAYVRWTERRNMQEYLRFLSAGLVDVKKMIEKVYRIDDVQKAFDELKSEKRPLMVILEYGRDKVDEIDKFRIQEKKIYIGRTLRANDRVNVAVVGVGSFATSVHLPNLEKLKDKFNIYAIVNRTSYKAKYVAQQYNAAYATSDIDEVLEDENVDLVLISTRHDSHAELTLKALKKGKNVFVEKPLATNERELKMIVNFFKKAKNPPLLFVGFNRRFSRYAREIKKHTDRRINPLFIRYRMNAGYIPLDHWVHRNGGRIVGEACHIIDLATFLTGSKIVSISVEELTPKTNYYSSSDNKSIILKYEDGSLAHIDYFACGSKDYPKEHMEVHFDNKTIVLDDYRYLKGYGIDVEEIRTLTSDKGQLEELEALYEGLKTGKWPIQLWELIQTTKATLLIANV